MAFPSRKELTTLTHRRIYQVASQRMEHNHDIVDLQNGLLSDRIEDPSQIPVCTLPARLLPVKFKTHSTIQKRVQVEFPLYLTTVNISTLSKNRRFASGISLNLL
jgi:hypothetical protein